MESIERYAAHAQNCPLMYGLIAILYYKTDKKITLTSFYRPADKDSNHSTATAIDVVVDGVNDWNVLQTSKVFSIIKNFVRDYKMRMIVEIKPDGKINCLHLELSSDTQGCSYFKQVKSRKSEIILMSWPSGKAEVYND